MGNRRYWRLRGAGVVVITVIVPLFLAGCGGDLPDMNRPRTVSSRDQAAAVLVAPTMVAPWSDVSAALKPNFTMTGDTAVSLVMPVTEGIQQSQLSALGIGLGLGLPGSATTGTTGNSASSSRNAATTGGVTTTTSSLTSGNTSNSTTTTSPGVVPTVPSGVPAGGVLPATVAAGALGLDPVLKYKSAYYLNQTVQLLNQEIDNVAHRRCYVPYVLRLKLAVMPYQPALAYSAHAHVAFLYGGNATGQAPDPSSALADECKPLADPGPANSPPLTVNQELEAADSGNATSLSQAHDYGLTAATNLVSAADKQIETARQDLEAAKDDTTKRSQFLKANERLHIALRAKADAQAAKDRDNGQPYKKQLPLVVPLLAADDLDVATRSQASETARQLGLALNFMVHGIGGNASANAVKQTLRTVADQDLSSALTISRDNDNTLYVEIAAANIASGRPTLIGQTYDIAVLLLIPRSYFGGIDPLTDFKPAKIGFVTSTDFRDVTTGAVLPAGKLENYVRRFDQILLPYSDKILKNKWKNIGKANKAVLIRHAIDLFQQGQYDTFVDQYFYVDSESDEPTPQQCQLTGDIRHTSHQCFPSSAAPALWASLIAINDDSPNKYGLFEAPIPAQIRIPRQTVLLSDDATSPIQAVLGNVTAQSVADLTATVAFTPSKTGDEPACAAANDTGEAKAKAAGTLAKFKPKPCVQKPGPGPQMFLPMTLGTFNPAAHTLALTMPSLGKMKITGFYPPSGGAPTTGATITFETPGCDLKRDVCATVDPTSASYTASPEPGAATVDAQLYPVSPAPPGLQVTPSGGTIVIAQGGGGTLPLVVSGKLQAGDDGAYLTVSGADVTSVVVGSAGAQIGSKQLGYKLALDTAYTLNLVNLTPGATVAIKVQGGASGKGDGTAPAPASFVTVPAAQDATKP